MATGLSPKALSNSNLATADAMVNLFGHSGFGVLLLGGVAGIITSWNAFIIGGSRILYAMAKNHMILNGSHLFILSIKHLHTVFCFLVY